MNSLTFVTTSFESNCAPAHRSNFVYSTSKSFCVLCNLAVINALKSLQDKIGRLELDRVRAEENLKALANEANDYKTILQKEHEFSESAQNAIEVQKRGIVC